MPKEFKERVRLLVTGRVSMTQYPNRERVEHLIMQVESLYVYATLKSVLISQTEDPMVKEMMRLFSAKSFTPPVVDNDGTMFKKYSMPAFSV